MFKRLQNKTEYYSENEVINSTRTLSVLSALLFLFFSIVDFWAIPSSIHEVLLVRGLVLASLLITYLSTFSSFFYRNKNYVLSAIFLITSMGIEYMVFKAKPEDHAYTVYFVGLVLILMTLYSWTYIKFSASLLITSIVIGGYVYIEFFTRPTGSVLSASDLLTNLFFINSAVVIGIVARLMRDRFIRENYLLHQSLKEAYNEKAAEAKDNAYMANHDPLTELPNRRYMTELLENSLLEAKTKDKVLILMFMDLNGFKQVNDVYGHAVGDEVLIIVAKRLELAIRTGDYLSRLGGDEFLLGLTMEKEHLSEVESMCEKFVTLISQPMNIDGLKIKISASVGIAAYPMHGNNINVLMDIADKKMYQAKKGITEKNRYTYGEFNQKEQEPVVIFPGKSKNTSK